MSRFDAEEVKLSDLARATGKAPNYLGVYAGGSGEPGSSDTIRSGSSSALATGSTGKAPNYLGSTPSPGEPGSSDTISVGHAHPTDRLRRAGVIHSPARGKLQFVHTTIAPVVVTNWLVGVMSGGDCFVVGDAAGLRVEFDRYQQDGQAVGVVFVGVAAV